MSALSAAAPRSCARVPTARIFLLEAASEFLRLLRAPSFSVPTIAFPLMFYVLFGVLLAPGAGPAQAAQRALASFLVIGSMAPGLFALGISLALDRERGLLELKRALPMPAGAYLAAKLAMAMLFAAIVALLMALIALSAGGVVLSLSQWAGLLGAAVAGVLPFCAIGLLVGAVTRASAAPAVLNLIYLPMSFLSGLWVPLSYLPHALGELAPLWPAWHLAQLALGIAGAAHEGGAPTHLLALALVGAACFALARRQLARPR
jgi:ABC-2 type transport system permease protein